MLNSAHNGKGGASASKGEASTENAEEKGGATSLSGAVVFAGGEFSIPFGSVLSLLLPHCCHAYLPNLKIGLVASWRAHRDRVGHGRIKSNVYEEEQTFKPQL